MMHKKRPTALLPATAVFLLLLCTTARASLTEYFKLKNLYTGAPYCLVDHTGDIHETDGTTTGLATAAYTWDDAEDERRAHWYTEDAGSGTVYIINRYSGRKLKYSDADTASGNKTLLYVAGSDTSADAKWTLDAESTHFHIQNAGQTGYFLFIKNTGGVELVDNTIYTRSDWDKLDLSAGASSPFTKYDENNVYSGYVSLVDDVETETRAIEADGNASLSLPAGKGINWLATAPANGVTIRYSMEDAPAGGGIDATIILRNTTTSQNTAVPITSKYAWLYGPENAETNNPAMGEARRVFDHVRAKLDISPGDFIRIDHGLDTNSVWIDFIETEVIPETNTPPANATIVTPGDDLQTVLDSASDGDVIFVSAGTYTFSDALRIYDSITLLGAGMWHTTFEFTSSNYNLQSRFTEGGIYVYNSAAVTLRDFHMTGNATVRGQCGSAFNSWSGYGDSSLIDSVSWSHLGVARFNNCNDMQVRNCRAYDNLAGGIVFMGTNSCFVADNNTVRHAGDDSFAGWSSDTGTYNYGYECRYNTAEFGARAGGIGLFGGSQAVIHNNLIRNMLPSCQGALRLTSTFTSIGFDPSSDSVFIDNEIESCKGDAQLVLLTRDYPINNVQFMNISISDASLTTEGIVKIWYNGTGAGDTITNIVFDTITVDQGDSTQPMYNVTSAGIYGSIDFIDCTRTATATPDSDINNSASTFTVNTTNCSF